MHTSLLNQDEESLTICPGFKESQNSFKLGKIVSAKSCPMAKQKPAQKTAERGMNQIGHVGSRNKN